MPPLLPKKTLANGGFFFININAWQALLGGILLGVAFGTALSMFLFSSSTPRLDKPKDPSNVDQLPRFTETNNLREEKHANVDREERPDGDEIVQEFINQELAPAKKTSTLRLNEGTRELTESERNGGWRFTPEVLKVAERHPKAKVISESEPIVLIFKQFLTEEEITHMLELASTHMSRSRVVSGKNGDEKDARTSYGAWLNGHYRDDTIAKIEERIHNAVGIPLAFGEGIYVLRYEKGQKYDPHTDNCARKGEKPRESCANFLKRAGGPVCGEGHGGASCGDRIATFIMVVNRSPMEGGSTVFPRSKISKDRVRKSGRADRASGFSDYCSSPLYFNVRPEPGDAILFWDYIPKPDIANHHTFSRAGSYEWTNQTTEAINDNASLHGGCPVLEGEKWIATKWIRSSHFA